MRAPLEGRAADWRSAGRSSRLASAAVVVGLHAGLVAALLQFDSVRTAVIAAAPVMVNLISPPPEQPTRPGLAPAEGEREGPKAENGQWTGSVGDLIPVLPAEEAEPPGGAYG